MRQRIAIAYNAGNKIPGRKRHIAVDTLSLIQVVGSGDGGRPLDTSPVQEMHDRNGEQP
jgi:hypothetical protein